MLLVALVVTCAGTLLTGISAADGQSPKPGRFTVVATPREGHSVLIGDTTGAIRVMNAEDGSIEASKLLPDGYPDALVSSRDGQRFVARYLSRSEPDTVSRLWYVLETYGTTEPSLCETRPTVNNLWVMPEFDESGSRILLLPDSSRLTVIDARTGCIDVSIVDPTQEIASACWWGSDQIITVGKRGSVRVWDARSGRLMRSPLDLDAPGHFVAVSPDGAQCFISSDGPVGRLLALPDFSLVSAFSGGSDGFGLERDDAFLTAQWTRSGSHVLLTTAPLHTMELHSRSGNMVWSHSRFGGNSATMRGTLDRYDRFAAMAPIGGSSGIVFDARTGSRVRSAGLSATGWACFEWVGDGAGAVLADYSSVARIVNVPSFTERFTLRLSPTDDLVVERPK